MADYERQYRPVTTAENQADDALTVRTLQETATAINNYKARFGPVLIPAAIYPGSLGFMSEETYDTERVVHLFAPRWVGWGYNKVHWGIGGHMNTATGTCRWRLYTSTQLYTGPITFDASFLGSPYGTDDISITSNTHQEPAGSEDLGLTRNGEGLVYLTLTAQNSVASGGVFCRLTGIGANASLD